MLNKFGLYRNLSVLHLQFGAPVAQLDRASGYEPEGRRFDSSRARHSLKDMFFVYVLQSESTGRHYVGFCQDVIQRVGQHNAGLTKSTKNRGPWSLVHQEACPTRSATMHRERFFKSGQGREELKRLIRERSAHSSVG